MTNNPQPVLMIVTNSQFQLFAIVNSYMLGHINNYFAFRKIHSLLRAAINI